jgi:hypothetical protein
MGREPRLHALGMQGGVLLEHVAARAGATVGARQGVLEQLLAALGLAGVGLVRAARRERLRAQSGLVVARRAGLAGVGAGAARQAAQGERAQQLESQSIH